MKTTKKLGIIILSLGVLIPLLRIVGFLFKIEIGFYFEWLPSPIVLIPLGIVLLLMSPINNWYQKNRMSPQESSESQSQHESQRNPYQKWIFIVIVGVTLTLPFHYIPSRLTAFPKNSLTFSHTIITEDFISSVIKRYNNASFVEKVAMRNEPVVRKLLEQGIISETTETTNTNEYSY